MTLLLIALLVGFATVTGIVLVDSGIRLWSAFGGIKAQQAMLCDVRDIPVRGRRPARVATRVSYARPVVSAPRRAAA